MYLSPSYQGLKDQLEEAVRRLLDDPENASNMRDLIYASYNALLHLDEDTIWDCALIAEYHGN